MSILKQTDPEKLINMLRSEIGEIIQSLIDLNIYNFKAAELQTENIIEDMENKNLQLLNLVRSKFKDDIISRLSELSSSKHGRLNFNYAADKFKIQKDEIKEFRKYLDEKHMIFHRNKNIAHKEMSPTWEQIDPKPAIKNRVLLQAVVWSIKIMKQFDREYYGENFSLIWKEERKRRYNFEMPASARYLLLPIIARVKKK